MTQLIQASFTKGVIGPALFGRVDASLYQTAVRQAKNQIVRIPGGISKRRGTQYIATVKDHTYAPRPIPFQYDTDDSYMMEFGDKYIRFIRDDGQVLESALVITGITKANPAVVTSAAHGYTSGNEVYIANVVGMTQINGKNYKITVLTTNTFSLQDQVTGSNINSTGYTTYSSGGISERIYEIVSPWAVADLPMLKYVQSHDVMTLTHPDYPIYELTRSGHTSWTLTVPTFAPSIDGPEFITLVANTSGSTTYKYQVTALKNPTLEESIPGLAKNSSHVITAITKANPAVVTTQDAHGFSNGDTVFINEVITGMTQVNGNSYIVAGATANTFQLTTAAGNVNSTGYGTYTGGGVVSDGILSIGGPTATVKLPAHGFLSGDEVEITTTNIPELQAFRTTITNVTTDTFDLVGVDSTQLTHAYTTTAYTNHGGSGERFVAGIIAISSNIVFASGTVDKLIDGNTTATTSAGAVDMPAATIANDHIDFDFGFSLGISEVTVKQSTATGSVAVGLQYSDDGITYAAGSPVSVWNTTSFAIATTGAGTSRHRYWRLNFPTGGQSYGTGWFQEVTFSTDAVFAGGRANETAVVTVAGNATAANTISWPAVTGAQSYNIYKLSDGVFGHIGSTTAVSFKDTNILATETNTPPQAKNPFKDTDQQPAAAGYYQQRRVFGGSNAEREQSNYSVVGATSNFSVSSPIKDDDAITATLVAQQVNEIRHYIPLGGDLLIFTSGAEWRVNSGPDSAFSDTTIKQKPQSNWGTSQLEPIVIGNIVFFVDQSATKIRSFSYEYASDIYDGNNMIILSYHLLNNGRYIKSSALGWTNDQRIYAVRDDGRVLTMTFEKDQEVVGWTWWNTMGLFSDVGALRTITPGQTDGIYFVVNRQINGNSVYYWEKFQDFEETDARDCIYSDANLSWDNPVAITGISLANPMVITAPAHGFSNGDVVEVSAVEWQTQYDVNYTASQPSQLNNNQYFVINAATNTVQLSLTSGGTAINSAAYFPRIQGGNLRKCVSGVSGLWHLEGQTVQIRADGLNLTGTVSGGAIAAINGTNKYARVHVGLLFVGEVETLDINSPQGQIEGHEKTITEVHMMLENSRFPLMGLPQGVGSTLEVKTVNLENLPTGIELYTGLVRFTMPQGWNWTGRMRWVSGEPEPCNVLYVAPRLEVDEIG